MTETIATIIGDMINFIFLKNMSIRMNINNIDRGAEIAICLNISTPKTDSATGKPAIWKTSPSAFVGFNSYNF